MNVKQKSIMFIATGCLVGNIPVAPGTFGSILGLPLAFYLAEIGRQFAFVLTFLFVMFSIKIAQTAAEIMAAEDPGCIVIDEIAGVAVTFFALPFNLVNVILGFVLFRAIDIFKPYPIKLVEKKLPGGIGIVLDDVVAGIYSNMLLRAATYFYLH